MQNVKNQKKELKKSLIFNIYTEKSTNFVARYIHEELCY